MPRITIRFALIALLLAAIVPTATGIGVSAYLNSRATVELLWRDLADEMIEDARQKALRYVESAGAQLRLSRLLTEKGLIDPADREGLLDYLHRCLLAHPNVTWCSYGGADGAYLAAYREPGGSIRLTDREREGGRTRYRDYRIKPDGSYALIVDRLGDFDPRTRPWWPVAEESDEPSWSEPFLFASRRQPGVVLVERQDDAEGNMIGVWLMEYELSAIARYLRDIRESAIPLGGPQSHADIYIVSGQGQVIGHPLAQTVRDRKGGPELIPAEEHEDEKLANAYLHTKESPGGGRHFEVMADGERYLAVSAPFSETGTPDWTVLIAVPAQALLGRIYENNRVAAWIAALAALLSVLMGIFIAERTMGRALRGIAKDLDQIGRLDFSAEGAVQMQCKRAGLEIIAGQRTRELAGADVVARPLDKLAVRGKVEGIVVYELIALREFATADQLLMEALGEEAMSAYLARDFVGAEAACRKLLKLRPGDVSASELLARTETLNASGVAENWDGIMVLTDK